ncbi:carbohydrate kinase family protein [Chloroflexota bacterium]
MTIKRVIGLGALNLDKIYKVERILEDGETLVEEAGLYPGGSAANSIYGLAKLGVSSGFIGIVGSDGAGEYLLEDFKSVGVDTQRVAVKRGEITGETLYLSDRTGKRSIYVLPGANDKLSFENIDLSYINMAGLLHISSFAGERQFQLLMELMKEQSYSVRVSFSPGMMYAARGLKALATIMSRTSVLFINQSELKCLTGRDVTDGANICLEYGCQIVVVTLGEGKKLPGSKVTATCYIKDSIDEYMVEKVSEDEINDFDATGVGDAFATGFLYGLVKDKSMVKCGRLGDTSARLCISKNGARQGLPDAYHLAENYFMTYKQQL